MTTASASKPLPALLIERRLLNAEQLAQAQAEVARSGLSLRRVLLQQRLVPEPMLSQLIAAQAGLVHVDLSTQRIRPEVLALMDADLARRHLILPLFRIEDTLTIAMADPLNVFVTDELRLRTHCDIKRVVAGEADIQQAIERWYGPAKGGPLPAAHIPAAPLRHALDALLQDAVARRAQTLWLEPDGRGLQVRWRIDGVTHEGPPVPVSAQQEVVTRLKALARLDITQRAQTQEGRCPLTVEGHALELRVRITPGPAGEAAVVHLQDTARPLPSLDTLGIETAWRAELLRGLQGGPGTLVVSAVQEAELTVMSAALAAARGGALPPVAVRGIVGTPAAADLAAAQALLAVRLLRRLCRHCAVPYEPEPALAQQLGLAEHVALFRAQGCPACQGIGFDGELGVCAWIPRPAAEAVGTVAARLRAAALVRVREGITSWEEVVRVLGALA